MPERANIGRCDECLKLFEYFLIHNGVNNSCYAYCDRCGRTAILDISESRFPVEMVKASAYKVVAEGVEPHLQPCECGGQFTARAAPKCPHCSQPLSAKKAAEYIERNPPKGSANWRWQMNWQGNYCIVIEGKQVRNNFK